MSDQITVKMYGLEANGTPIQIAELKKLLDEQNTIKIKFIPQTQPFPWTVLPYIYPQPYIYDKNTVSPNTWKQDFYCGTPFYGYGSTTSTSENVTIWN